MEMRIVPCPGPWKALGRAGRMNGPGHPRAAPFPGSERRAFSAAASWAP